MALSLQEVMIKIREALSNPNHQMLLKFLNQKKIKK